MAITSNDDLFDRLSGTDNCIDKACTGCLQTDTYKDTKALVCAECGTPAVRVW